MTEFYQILVIEITKKKINLIKIQPVMKNVTKT